MAVYTVTVEIMLDADSIDDAMCRVMDDIIVCNETVAYGITHVEDMSKCNK